MREADSLTVVRLHYIVMLLYTLSYYTKGDVERHAHTTNRVNDYPLSWGLLCVRKTPKNKNQAGPVVRVNCSSPDVRDHARYREARVLCHYHIYICIYIYKYMYIIVIYIFIWLYTYILIYSAPRWYLPPRTRMICVDARAKPISTHRHRRRRVLIFNGRVALKTKRHRRPDGQL